MGTKQVLIHELLEWASSHNTVLHPNVEIYQDNFTGLSFKASERIDIAPTGDSSGGGTRLVSCSYQTTLSYLNATISTFPFHPHGSEIFPQKFLTTLENQDNCHVIGHFFLMQQYLLREKSFWWNYVRLLPQPDQPELLGIPIWWNETDRRFLHGTNAQPPIEIREALWTEEWTKAIEILDPAFPNCKDYNKKLYFWAATIFGTRSFRASLTMPEETLPKDQREKIYEKVAEDRFSVLLPVLDIGNHDGINRVEWSKHPEDGHFALSTCHAIEKGQQIYNFYGDKSNSELLVGYGFTLESPERDVVNLKLVPTPEVIALRRSQICHQQPKQKEEEFMFGIRRGMLVNVNSGVLGLEDFPHGLLEVLICMVASSRERKFVEKNPNYCLHMDIGSGALPGPLYRAFFSAIQILSIKIQLEMQRLHDTGEGLGSPQNYNQTMALKYRAAQKSVIVDAQARLSNILEDTLLFKSFDSQYPEISENGKDFPSGLLTLKHAFSWLEAQYPDVHEAVAQIISEDQEEELPLNWDCLVVDWDYTYWCVWIYIVLSFQQRDGIDEFTRKHPSFGGWLKDIKERATNDTFHTSASEEDTINLTIQAVSKLPCFKDVSEGWEELRNIASFIAKEEGITMDYEGITQQVLPISEKGLEMCGTY